MTLLAQFSEDLADLVARTSPAVVGLAHGRGQGSGLVLAPDGYILTNSHVARARGNLAVRMSGIDEAEAELVGADDRTDLAVVRVPARDLPALSLGSPALRVGQLVVAIGNPLGFERSVSLGVVSALYRTLPTRTGGLEGLVQTDAAVNPGNSGGPLVDAQGEVVGITTAMVPFAPGLGFAIPASTASWVAAVLMHAGEVKRPYIGIAARAEELHTPIQRDAGQDRGVRVVHVEPGTPAERAGLRAGDVLLAANESALGTLDDLQKVMVLSAQPQIELTILRDGHRQPLGIRPDPRRAIA